MLESAISGIAIPVFEGLLKAGGQAFSQIREARQSIEVIDQAHVASREYYKKYIQRHGSIKVMPGLMKEPKPLDSIYVAIKLLDERSIRQFVTQDALEQAYREHGKRRFQLGEGRHDGLRIARDKQRLMVLGQPGVGKSTFLRKLGLEALKGQDGQLESQQIPVLIELKTLRSKDIILNNVIADEFRICGFPEPKLFTDSALDQGKLLILLDGLDEVPTHRTNTVIEKVEDFVSRYDRNRFVVSCRTAAYRSSFKRFTDVTVADFDDEQIKQFIYQWFNSELDHEAKIAELYWDRLQRPENMAAKELAQTPLLLTFLCLVYDREQILPLNRYTLYENALDILLKEWSAQKRLDPQPIYEGFHPALEKVLLGKIAYDNFKKDHLFFSKSSITGQIAVFLADTLGAPEYLDSEDVLEAIEKQQGILVERAANTYSFSHLTLQEHLTAQHIVKNQLIDDLVSEHLTNKRWREVFLLAIGRMEELGHQLLEYIDKQAKTNIKSENKLCKLLQWANQVTCDTVSQLKPFEKRGIAILIASSIALVHLISIARISTLDSSLDSGSNKMSNIASVIVRIITIVRSISGISDSNFDSILDELILIAGDFAVDTAVAVNNARAIAIDGIGYSTSDFSLDSNSPRKDYSTRASTCILNAVRSAVTFQVFNSQVPTKLSESLQTLEEQMPVAEASADVWRCYNNKLESILLNLFNLKIDLISFSLKEWNDLHDYLYANELLIRCKDTSIGISRKAWEAIEAQLLKI